MSIPAAVEEAARLDFFPEVTGFLYLPELCGFSIVGTIYHDRRARFQNGRLIRTSDVQEFIERDGYWIACTLQASRYVLISANGPHIPLITDRARHERASDS